MINGPSKMLFLNFCLFHFFIFQITIVKNFMRKPSFYILDFEGSNEVPLRQKYFLSIDFIVRSIDQKYF